MATDGPTPPDCDQEIYKNGDCILTIQGASNAVENWVKAVAAKAGARVDWHYIGGIATVLHLGDQNSWARTAAAARELEPELKGKIHNWHC
jgi:hypothetical protein